MAEADELDTAGAHDDAHDAHGKPGKAGAADAGPDGKKKKDRKQTIIVAASVLGVIIAYLTYRARSGGAAASSTAGTTSVPLSDSGQAGAGSVLGTGGGGSTDQSFVNQGFQQLLDGQAAILNQFQATGAGTQGSAPTTYTSAQFVSNPGSAITFLQNVLTHTIYEVEPTANGGSVYYALNPAQYAQLGKPKPQQFTPGKVPVKLPTSSTP